MKFKILIFTVLIFNFFVSNTYDIWNMSNKTLKLKIDDISYAIKPERCEYFYSTIGDIIIYYEESGLSLSLTREQIDKLKERGMTIYINLKKDKDYIELNYTIRQQTFEISSVIGKGSAYKRVSQPGQAINYNKVEAKPG